LERLEGFGKKIKHTLTSIRKPGVREEQKTLVEFEKPKPYMDGYTRISTFPYRKESFAEKIKKRFKRE